MKKFLLVIVAISVAFFTTSCETDSNGNPVYKMNATIDGQQWTAPLPMAVLSNGVLVVTGSSLTGEIIALTINGDVAKSYTQSLLPVKMECGASYKASLAATTADAFISTMGIVTLTKVDATNKLVSGTFEFTLANTTAVTLKQITKGTFNDVTYIVK